MKKVSITRLLPQREPILMVDELVHVEEDQAETSFEIRADNYFIEKDRLAEVGLIEHIAQSASAFAGYKAMETGSIEPPVGLIGEIKRFHCYRCPQVGEVLHTTVRMGAEVAGITLLTGEVRIQEEIIADTQMKIFVP
ncbi:MAG TPA: beta-hydroxyacyl-ACP dehydratase [Candidatus Parabacteroides intestinavium]|nr:beta-hydroxyacyl-ACP dehydratase [Candidatus Parabacteroides intestinavium]